ncbi:MAG: hypothetical protein ACXWQQ_08735 [Pseudobdellovibrio sp.]
MKKIIAVTAIALIGCWMMKAKSNSAPLMTSSSENENLTSTAVKQQPPLAAAITAAPKAALLQKQLATQQQEMPELAEQKKFETQLKTIISQIPLNTLKEKPPMDEDGDIHGFLKDEIIEAKLLGKLRALTLEKPEFAASSQVTYAGCAERTNFSNSVRAICFGRALELSMKLKNPQMIVQLDVPLNIRNLARKIIN